MRKSDIEQSLKQALEALYEDEIEIIVRDAAERTICAQLVAILSTFFPNHSVHAEYNRHGVWTCPVLVPLQVLI